MVKKGRNKGYWLFALCVLFLTVLFITFEEQSSAPFAKCVNNWQADYATDQPQNDSYVVAEIIGGHVACLVRAVDRHNGLFAAIAAFIVAWFTFSLRESTDRLWEAGEEQRESSERIARLQRESAERIGEAQVRAYVNIKSASLQFISPAIITPLVEFVATNSGQSPARNFLWRMTLQYVGGKENRSQQFVDESWTSKTGVDIPATSDSHPERAIIPHMSVTQNIEIPIPGLVITVARIKIEFRFTDVFDRIWCGEQFYAGIMRAGQVSPEDSKIGTTRWSADISPVAKPSDWDDI